MDKVTNSQIEKHNFQISNEEMSKCVKCKKEMIKHDSSQLEDNDECLDLECIAESSHNNEIWYICQTCNYYYLECPSCHKYCDLISHSYYSQVTREKVDAIPNNSVKYMDVSSWCPTGPDGGMYHTWKCDGCNFEGSYTDK